MPELPRVRLSAASQTLCRIASREEHPAKDANGTAHRLAVLVLPINFLQAHPSSRKHVGK